MTQGGNQAKRPEQINGFKVGDRVITPLGRYAIITGLRRDGFIDAKYENRHPALADVILQPNDLRLAEPTP